MSQLLSQQDVWSVVKDLPEDQKRQVVNFAVTLNNPTNKEISQEAEHAAKMDNFFSKFKDVEIDEQAIKELRERSMI